jgi:SAM-dependent methyltransferase
MDHDLIELFAEYSGLPVDDVRRGVDAYTAFNAADWDDTPGQTWKQRAEAFYAGAHGYVFDLIHGNRSKEHLLGIWKRFDHLEWIEKSGPQVLEFGGGTGIACSLFRDLGRAVTYLDVPGPVSDFARWYFQRTGQDDIEMLMTPTDRVVLPAGRQWDFVFTDAVLEHLVDPAAAVEVLSRATRPGGILYLIIDAHNVGPAFPMHRHVYLDELLAGAPTLRDMDHLVHDGDGYNVFRQPARAPVTA